MQKNVSFSLMTMNIRFGLADDSKNGWDKRKKYYPDFLARYQPDLLAIQELNDFQTRFLHDLLSGYQYIGERQPSPHWWQDNLIFYARKIKCIESSHYYLSDTPDRESKFEESQWPRQCTMGLFRCGKLKLVMVNTHFDFKEKVQAKSARLIVRLLSRFKEEYPVIITGDFNSNPDSNAGNIFRDNGFVEVFDKAHSTTFHEFKGHETGRHLDWILYRGSITVTDKKIVKDKFNGRYLSDHFPVWAKFRAVLP